MTYPNANSSTMDGRQTSGRKGFAYDWRSVLLEGDVVEEADRVLASAAMSETIGLLLS